MMYGPEEPSVAQKKLNGALHDFFEIVLVTKEGPSLEAQKEFLDKLHLIINQCNQPNALSLDTLIHYDTQRFTTKNVIDSLKLLALDEGLKAISERYGIGYGISVVATREIPKKFTQQDNDLIDEHGNEFRYKSALAGRGQKGLANFYTDDVNQVLIKEDDPATCVLEGTAYFVKHCQLLPKTLEDCVNFASVGVVKRSATGEPMVVSIQDRVMPSQAENGGKVRSWDEIVYGVKRNPNTIFSFESWYPDSIKQNIAALSPKVKWQLAASLFSSAAVGDESLHVGQFMALLDKDNNITGIKRIDLGARERFAVARNQIKQHDPFHDSTQYQAHGQWGKDYLSFLLADPSFRKIYTMIWLNLASKDKSELKDSIKAASKTAFIMEFQAIPENQREKTLNDILDVFNKDIKTTKMTLSGQEIEQRIVSLADQISDIDANRAIDMLEKAKHEYNSEAKLQVNRFNMVKDTQLVKELFEAVELKDALLFPLKNTTVHPERAFELVNIFDDHIRSLLSKCNGRKNENNLQQMQLLSETSVDLLQSAYLRLLNNTQDSSQNKDQLKALEELINKYQTIEDLSHYCLSTKSKDKIPYMLETMGKVFEGKAALANYITNGGFIDHIFTHNSTYSFARSFVASTQTEGATLLRKIYKIHQIDEAPLMLSALGRQILTDIEQQRFSHAMEATSKCVVSDVLTPDEKGMTALHYLMMNENLDADGMQTIVNILKSTLGKAFNSSVDIPNREGKTPLDLLMQNKNTKVMIDFINKSQIRGYRSNYMVDDFFKLEKYDAKLVEQLKGMSQQIPAAKSGWSLW